MSIITRAVLRVLSVVVIVTVSAVGDGLYAQGMGIEAPRPPHWQSVSLDSMDRYELRAALTPPIYWPANNHLHLAREPELGSGMGGAVIVEGTIEARGTNFSEEGLFVVTIGSGTPPVVLWSGIAERSARDNHGNYEDHSRGCLYVLSSVEIAYVQIHDPGTRWQSDSLDQLDGVYEFGWFGEHQEPRLAWSKPVDDALKTRCLTDLH